MSHLSKEWQGDKHLSYYLLRASSNWKQSQDSFPTLGCWHFNHQVNYPFSKQASKQVPNTAQTAQNQIHYYYHSPQCTLTYTQVIVSMTENLSNSFFFLFMQMNPYENSRIFYSLVSSLAIGLHSHTTINIWITSSKN